MTRKFIIPAQQEIENSLRNIYKKEYLTRNEIRCYLGCGHARLMTILRNVTCLNKNKPYLYSVIDIAKAIYLSRTDSKETYTGETRVDWRTA